MAYDGTQESAEGASDRLRSFVAEAPHVREPHLTFLDRCAKQLVRGAMVLDVGSGEAPYRELFDGHTYVTVDWAQQSAGWPVDIVAPANAIPLDTGSVDAIVCTQVLEHVPEPGEVLDEFFRLLKPGGQLWLTAPLTWYLHEIPHDYYRYTAWGLRHLLERSGFIDIDIQAMNDSMGTVAELLRHLRWIIGAVDEPIDERRAIAGDMFTQLAATVESVGYLDTQRLLPLGFSAEAIRPAGAPVSTVAATEQQFSTTVSYSALDVSVVITGHGEGTLAHHTFRSLAYCVAEAIEHGFGVEVVAVLDRPDEATREFFHQAVGATGYFANICGTSLIEVDEGDPGLARNAGIRQARGEFVGVVDADNLLSKNWLTAALSALRERSVEAVVHPEYLVTFDAQQVIWPQIQSDSLDFRLDAFYSFNYWDTICVTTRELFLACPYGASGATFGPEDWHWNTLTLAAGAKHLTAPDTAMFYRAKRTGSRNMTVAPSGRPVQRTPLLTSRRIAEASSRVAASVAQAHEISPLFEDVFEEVRARGSESLVGLLTRVADEPPAPTVNRLPSRRRSARRGSSVNPVQYRALYDDLAHFSDEAVLDHFEDFGRGEGRIPALTASELACLQRDHFLLSHYRVLYAELALLSDAELVRHYFLHGRAESRRARLTESELRASERFDASDYRAVNADLVTLTDTELAAHFLHHGIAEGRQALLTPAERARRGPLPPRLLQEWRAAHALEPAIPFPSSEVVSGYHWLLPPAASQSPDAVWWSLVAQMPDRADFIFFAPWIRMGGGDAVLARYAELVCRLRPDEQVVVITTKAESTCQDWLPASVHLVELPAIEGYGGLSAAEQCRLVANLVIQYAPRAVHILNSPAAFDAVERYSTELSECTKLFLSTFVVDRGPGGELFNWIFKRRPGFLDDVSAVIVDNEALVDELWEVYRLPRQKFVVHRHPVTLPDISRRSARRPTDGIDVLWAARFDHQKRPDILTDIVAEAQRRELPIRFHVFGASVLGEAEEFHEDLARMSTLGVAIQGPYTTFADLPPERFDAFLMTSQYEGMPLTLLDAMANGIPVVAAAVGGVPEILDATTGCPVIPFDDVNAYVDALAWVLANPDQAEARTMQARDRLAGAYSWSEYEKAVASLPGYL